MKYIKKITISLFGVALVAVGISFSFLLHVKSDIVGEEAKSLNEKGGSLKKDLIDFTDKDFEHAQKLYNYTDDDIKELKNRIDIIKKSRECEPEISAKWIKTLEENKFEFGTIGEGLKIEAALLGASDKNSKIPLEVLCNFINENKQLLPKYFIENFSMEKNYGEISIMNMGRPEGRIRKALYAIYLRDDDGGARWANNFLNTIREEYGHSEYGVSLCLVMEDDKERAEKHRLRLERQANRSPIS